MFDGRWRTTFDKGFQPIGAQLKRTGVTANQLTTAGLVLAAAAAVAIANGALRAGLVFVGLSALLDVLDGAVAKASGTASSRGAFFDSVVDRVADGLLLGGVAWYLIGVEGPYAPILPMAIMGAWMLISYERAKAESLGFHARGGLMERAERVIILALGLLFHPWLMVVLWAMLTLSLFTVGQRFAVVWRQASQPAPERPLATRWRSRRVARSTRRAWRRRGVGLRQHLR